MIIHVDSQLISMNSDQNRLLVSDYRAATEFWGEVSLDVGM